MIWLIRKLIRREESNLASIAVIQIRRIWGYDLRKDRVMAECGTAQTGGHSDDGFTRFGHCKPADGCKDPKKEECQKAFLGREGQPWVNQCICSPITLPALAKGETPATACAAEQKKFEGNFPQPATKGDKSLPRLKFGTDSAGSTLRIEHKQDASKQNYIVARCVGSACGTASDKCILEYKDEKLAGTAKLNPVQQLTLRCSCLPKTMEP